MAFPITEDEARSLYESHEARVFRFALLATRRRALAADITQETFIRAFRSYDSFDHGRPFEPWLLRIALNVTRTLTKRQGRLLPDPAPDAAATAPSPELVPIEAEERRALWHALAALTDRQREILVLHFYNDLALTECAQVLGIPTGTAKSRLNSALGSLRSRLPSWDREGGTTRG